MALWELKGHLMSILKLILDPHILLQSFFKLFCQSIWTFILHSISNINCSSNFGPNQHEKLIPVVINSIISGNSIPVYGDGSNIRDWIFVEDHIDAITKYFSNFINETFNVGGNNEMTNIQLIKKIIQLTDDFLGKEISSEKLISFVKDRPGHDFRYSIDFSKLSSKLNWQPKANFNKSLTKTIQWYIEN